MPRCRCDTCPGPPPSWPRRSAIPAPRRPPGSIRTIWPRPASWPEPTGGSWWADGPRWPRTGRWWPTPSSSGPGPDTGGGRVRALVIRGADSLTDFPDGELARRGLAGADFVVSVASSPSPLCDLADVVLPAAEAHERPGTTTNIEGRISRL